MGQSAGFWNKIAPRYARQPIADEAAYQKKLEMTRAYFRPDMQVLEIGCGTGSTALLHAPHVKHILAVDFSQRMLDIAQAKAAAESIGNITFKCAGIDDFTAPAAAFDMVLALSVLHLLEDKEAAMAKVYTFLKPGGFFVSSTACLGDMPVIFRVILRVILPLVRLPGLAPPVAVFDSQALQDSMLAAGFKIERSWRPGKNKAIFIIARKPEDGE